MTDTNESSGMLDMLARHRTAVGSVALVLAVAVAVLTFFAAHNWRSYAVTHVKTGEQARVFATRSEADEYLKGMTNDRVDHRVTDILFWPVVQLGLGVALGLVVGGLMQLLLVMDERARYLQRIIILVAGGFIGLAIVLAGLSFGWHWRADVLSWLEPASEQRRNGWGVVLTIVLILGGAAVAFLASLPARAEERQNVVLRRTVYGYNALLTGLLLFLNLLVFNCLVSARTTRPLDFTATSIYTLSPTSENILRNLKSPVSIRLILAPFSQEYGGLDLLSSSNQLLANARQFTDKITAVQELNPSSPRDLQALIELGEKYPTLIDVSQLRGDAELRHGILVIFNEGQSNEDHRFIPAKDLFTSEGTRGGPALFSGEDAVMTALTSLSDELKKTIVYFTQGHGELNLTGTGSSRDQPSMGEFKNRMEKKSFEFKPLPLNLGEAVPADANLLVVAGPRETLPEHAVKAIRDYLDRQGKLVALLDLNVDRSGQVIPSGLEPILLERNIAVKNERILSLSGRIPPTYALLGMKPGVQNELAVSLQRGTQFLVEGPRPVEALPARQPGAAHATPLMETRGPILVDNQLSLPPIRLLQGLGRAELEKRVSERPVPVAVLSADAIFDHSQQGRTPPTEKPRLIVFGSSSLLLNRFVADNAIHNYDLMSSTFNYLRDRKDSLGIQPKTHAVFTVDQKIGMGQLFWLPAAILLLAIAAVGTGVWLVRRA